jgi:hypothetical protein
MKKLFYTIFLASTLCSCASQMQVEKPLNDKQSVQLKGEEFAFGVTITVMLLIFISQHHTKH